VGVDFIKSPSKSPLTPLYLKGRTPRGEMTHQLCFANPRYFSRFTKEGSNIPYLIVSRTRFSQRTRFFYLNILKKGELMGKEFMKKNRGVL